jgi:hypothetical protein
MLDVDLKMDLLSWDKTCLWWSCFVVLMNVPKTFNGNLCQQFCAVLKNSKKHKDGIFQFCGLWSKIEVTHTDL